MPSKNTTYEESYERFGRKVTDFDLAEMLNSDDDETQQFVAQMLFGYLEASIAKFKKCATDLSDRNDEAGEFNSTLEEIEKEILAMMMVTEWLEPQLNSTLYTSQFFGTKEQKFYAQANQLDKLMTLKNTNEVKTRKLRRDYTYRNIATFLEG